MGFFCFRCGKDISKDIIRCSNCGTPIGSVIQRSPILNAASIFDFIAASFSGLSGSISLVDYVFSPQTTGTAAFGLFLSRDPILLAATIIGIIGFALGLTSGVLSRARLYLPLTLTGVVFVTVGGAWTLSQAISVLGPLTSLIVFEVPVVTLGGLALVFTLFTRKEFSQL